MGINQKEKKERTKVIFRNYNHSIDDVEYILNSLDKDFKTEIYASYTMSQLQALVNSDAVFCKHMNELGEMKKRFKNLTEGLAKLKSRLDHGGAKLTEQEIADTVVKNYGDVSDENKLAIRERLGLMRKEDVPKPEPVKTGEMWIDEVVKRYSELTADQKVDLGVALLNDMDFATTIQLNSKVWGKFKNSWNQLCEAVKEIP